MIIGSRFMRKYRPTLEAVTNIYLLFLLVLVSATLTVLMFLDSRQGLHIAEDELALRPPDPAKVKEARQNGRVVKVGLSIRNFLKFDMTEDDFEFDGILWFEGDPAVMKAANVDKFFFDKGKVIERMELAPQGTRRLFNVKARVQSDLQYRDFPLDDHRLDLVLRNVDMTVDDAVLITDQKSLVVPRDALDESWEPFGQRARSGVGVVPLRAVVDATGELVVDAADNAAATPEVVFSLDFKRVGLRRLFIIFVPLFFIFFLGLSSLTLDPTLDFSNVLALSLASLTSLLYYQLVVQGITPRGDYFTLSDRIYTLLLIIATMTFCLLVVHMHQYWRWKEKTELAEVLQYIRISGAIVRRLALILFLAAMLVCLVMIMP